MRLTSKLLGYLNRIFDKDPKAFLALRVRYAGAMSWSIADEKLSFNVTGGVGSDLVIDLAQHTMSSLAGVIAGQAGYTVLHISNEHAALSARVLLDGAADQDDSNGDHLFGYTSLLWAWLEALAAELETMSRQIDQAILQLNVNTGSDIWLDEIGGFYGVVRDSGETDASYGPRIIAETLRPRSNNVALELALEAFSGQPVRVVDVIANGDSFPLHNGVITRNAAHTYNAEVQPVYNLFDIEYAFDLLNGGDFTTYQSQFRALIQRLRAAGTHLRSLVLTGSRIEDVFVNQPTDALVTNAMVSLADTSPDITDTSLTISGLLGLADTSAGSVDTTGAMTATFRYDHGGSHRRDGSITYSGWYRIDETLEGVVTGLTKLTDDIYLRDSSGAPILDSSGAGIRTY